jgi:hypothetical protein
MNIKELTDLRAELRAARDALDKLPADAQGSRLALMSRIARIEAQIDGLISK